MENYRKPDLTQEKTFQSLYFMNMHLTEKKLQEAAKNCSWTSPAEKYSVSRDL